jgi:hypothetical protein
MHPDDIIIKFYDIFSHFIAIMRFSVAVDNGKKWHGMEKKREKQQK